MPTIIDHDLHDHTGLRWLLPFLAVLTITVFGTLLMLLYPHVLR